MAHVVVFSQLAFQKVKLDKDGNRTIEPDGPEEVVAKGHYVPDYVPEWQLAAFTQAGMIVPVANRPEPEPQVEVGPPAPTQPVTPVEPVTPTGPVALKPTDSRSDWEAYATSDAVGMTSEEAVSFPNKAALIDAVDARLNQK
jgi:type IV secretory pathway VirB10-like protein